LIGVDDSECLNLQESIKIAQILEKAGADAVQLRSQWIGRHDSSFITDHMCYPGPPVPLNSFPKDYDNSRRGAGANVKLAEAVKKVVSIPVITVGRLNPELGETILREGKADFIAMNRRIWADPELPNKIASGRLDDIAPCTSCTVCKTETKPRRCRINGALGTEQPYIIEPAIKKKKVVVVGGGPGGMEAARVAALRGHEVILFEKARKLGGLLPIAATVKGLEIEDIPSVIHYLKHQITKLGVKINVGKKADLLTIEQIKPDAVILAMGGATYTPEIPGINGRNVVNLLNLDKLIYFFGPRLAILGSKLWMPIGKRVIVLGGGIHGCEIAEMLTKLGRKVTLVGSEENFGEEMVDHLRLQLFWWFHKKGVELIPGVKPLRITGQGLIILNKGNYKQTIEADTIVPAVSMKPNLELFNSLQGKVPELYLVGDCKEPRLIPDAIGEAYKIARTI
jgi:2,4-dienoyl-CoA reductase (NADPH2)